MRRAEAYPFTMQTIGGWFDVAGLDSFRLDASNATQDAEDIRAYNMGGLPLLAARDVHVTGDLSVDGNETVGATSLPQALQARLLACTAFPAGLLWSITR